MTNVSKIVLSSSRDIPFNKLVLSQANVRRILRAASLSLAALDFLASSPVEFLRYAWAEPESLEFGALSLAIEMCLQSAG